MTIHTKIQDEFSQLMMLLAKYTHLLNCCFIGSSGGTGHQINLAHSEEAKTQIKFFCIFYISPDEVLSQNFDLPTKGKIHEKSTVADIEKRKTIFGPKLSRYFRDWLQKLDQILKLELRTSKNQSLEQSKNSDPEQYVVE